jgi:hypothetical protein
MKTIPLSAMSYPMLRLTISAIMEHWAEISTDDIYHIDDRMQGTAEYLSDLFNEIAKRIPQ